MMKKGKQLLAFVLASMLVAGTLQIPVIAAEDSGIAATAAATVKEAADEGVSDEGVSDEGVSDEGVSGEGVSDEGISDEGVSNEGVSGEGVSDEGVYVEGASGEGVSIEDVSDDAVTDETDEPEKAEDDSSESDASEADEKEENNSDPEEDVPEEDVSEDGDADDADIPEETVHGENNEEAVDSEEEKADSEMEEALDDTADGEDIETPAVGDGQSDETEYITVTYDANGGYFPDPNGRYETWKKWTLNSTSNVTYKDESDGDKVYVPYEIEHSDASLHFVGWSYEKDGEIDFVAHTFPGSDFMADILPGCLKANTCTLYAVWSKDILDSGYYLYLDENVVLIIDKNDVLTIRGNGKYGFSKSSVQHYYQVREVVVEEGITLIGNDAFGGSAGSICNQLTYVSLPKSLRSIDSSAFESCKQLQEVEISEGLENIGQHAFSNCSSLVHITIPTSIKKIGAFAFFKCENLPKITIPSGIKEIGDHTFAGCSNLTEIVLPKTVESIGEGAFSGCSSLPEIIIPENVENIGEMAFYECSSLTDVVIPDKVSEIGESAFGSCENLASVTIPESVTDIGEEAFECCADDLVIYGYTGSCAERYAKENFITFRDLNTKSIEDAIVAAIPAKTYSGKAQKPAIEVKLDGITLKVGTNYTVSYKNNTNAGTATVTITGIGNYEGTIEKTFTISKAAQSLTIKTSASPVTVGNTATITLSGAKGKKSYKSSNTKIATVTASGKVTAKKVGSVTITVTSAATANYKAASKSITIKVRPKSTSIIKLTPAKGAITVKWKKQASQTTGYEIQCSVRSDLATHKSVFISKTGTVTKKVTGLKAKTKYYVRIRTYKTVSGTKYYSAWSAVKTVKTK